MIVLKRETLLLFTGRTLGVIPSTCLPLVVSVAQTSEHVSSRLSTRAGDVHVFTYIIHPIITTYLIMLLLSYATYNYYQFDTCISIQN